MATACVFIIKYIFVSLKLLSLSIISNQEWKLEVERKETKLLSSTSASLSPWPLNTSGLHGVLVVAFLLLLKSPLVLLLVNSNLVFYRKGNCRKLLPSEIKWTNDHLAYQSWWCIQFWKVDTGLMLKDQNSSYMKKNLAFTVKTFLDCSQEITQDRFASRLWPYRLSRPPRR